MKNSFVSTLSFGPAWKNKLRRPLLIWCDAGIVFTILHCLVSLLGIPGYEAAQAQTLFFALASGFLTITIFNRRSSEATDLLTSASWSAFALLGMLAVNTAIICVSGFFRGTCQWADGLLWFALLPLPTIILGVASGSLAAASFRKRRTAYIAYLLFASFMLIWELLVIWKLPVTFAYNMLLGYFPGPVYDRAVRVSVALAASRFEALSLSTVFFCLAALIARFRFYRGYLHKRPAVSYTMALILSLLAFAVAAAYGQALGTAVTREFIHKELGGELVGKNVVLRYPEDLTKDKTRLLLLDAEFRFHQQSRFLGLKNPPPVSAYFYRNADEKKALMGAAGTQYADCSNREMHMNIQRPPHSVLKHEIVHVLAAPWGIKGLGFSLILGITEGLAVASEGWRGDYPIPLWAAAMKKIGRLPKMSKNSGATGFWKISGSRSYLAWGGFTTWLIDNYSMDAIRIIYQTGDWQKAFGASVEELEIKWRKHLDAMPVPERLMRIATGKFFRKSLFEARCARTVGTISEDAWIAYDKGHDKKATRLFEKAWLFSGQNPRHGRSLMKACYASRQYERAWEIADEIVKREGKATPDLKARKKRVGDQRALVRAMATQARIAWIRGDNAQAHELFAAVRAADVYSSLNREAAVSMMALNDPTIEEYLRKYFVDPDAGGTGDYQLLNAIDAQPENGALHYLLGRKLRARRQYADAARELDLALNLGMDDSELTVEAWRQLGINHFEARWYREAIKVFQNRRPTILSQGKRMEADEWIERATFAQSYALPKSLQ